MFEVGNKITGTLASNKKYGITNTGMLCGEVVSVSKEEDGVDMIDIKIINHIDSAQEGRTYTSENSEELFRLVSEEEFIELKKEIELDKSSWITDNGKQFTNELRAIYNGRLNTLVSVQTNKYCGVNKETVTELLLPFYAMDKEMSMKDINISLSCIPSGDDGIEEKVVGVLSYVATEIVERPIINLVETKDNEKARESLENILSIDASPWKKQDGDFPEGVSVYRNSVMELEGEEKKDFSNQLLVLANGVNTQLVISLMPFLYDFIGHPMNEADVPEEFLKAWKKSIDELNRDLFVESLNSSYNQLLEIERQKKRKEMLDQFAKELPGIRQGEYQRQIEDIQYRIKDYESSLRNYYQDLENVQSKLFYLKNGKPSEQLGDFGDFINSLGDKLKTIAISGSSMTLCLEADLAFFDEDEWEILRDNEDSNVNTATDFIRSLLYDIFDDRSIIMTFEQKLTIELSVFNIVAKREIYEYNKEAGEGLSGIPNPHLHYYNCWGDYINALRNFAQDYNYTMLVGQIIAAISSLNLSDGAVLERFIDQELYKEELMDVPCLRDAKTGERFSIREYKGRYEANQYRESYREILAKTEVSIDDENLIDSALHGYSNLSVYTKAMLASEKELLDGFKKKIHELKQEEQKEIKKTIEKFKKKHSAILKKDIKDITLEDEPVAQAMTEEFCKFPSNVANLMKEVSTVINSINTKIVNLKAEAEKEAE